MKFCYNCANTADESNGRCPFCGWDLSNNTSKEVYHLQPGSALKDGKYLIGRAIGSGGFGVTYIGRDTVLNRRVAIKEYFPTGFAYRIPSVSEVSVYTGDRELQYSTGLSRFLLEAQNMAKVDDDPNIVKVHEYFEENNTAYIVMEYLNGEDVKHYLNKRGGKLPYKEAIAIIKPVCSALTRIHNEGLVHRDISPDNIFITKSNTVKLIDFGAARLAFGDKEKTLSVILKRSFAPPEQYNGKSKQGPFTDIYALGATLYLMITGKVPAISVNRLANDELVPPSAVAGGIPKNVDKAVMRAMELDSDKRFGNAGDFLKALENEFQSVCEKKESKISKEEPPKTGGKEELYIAGKKRPASAVSKIAVAFLITLIICGAAFAALLLTGVIETSALPIQTNKPSHEPKVTPELNIEPTAAVIITFSDSSFENAFRSKYGIAGDITEDIILSKTELDLSECSLSNITDAAMFKNLTVLKLNGNSISDINPIANLTKLTKLVLSDNRINDINALSALINLSELHLHNNQISDISPISKLTHLNTLSLFINQITDIAPLSGLTELTGLGLAGNKISDLLPLSGLVKLVDLDLRSNGLAGSISLEPLYSLSSLKTLAIKDGNGFTKGQIDVLCARLPNTAIH